MSLENLDELLVKARQYDEAAMAAICEFYYPKVLKFIHYRTQPQLAADLTGEVFLKVMRNFPLQQGRFEPWLFKIARNTVIDFYRRKGSYHIEEVHEEHPEYDPVKPKNSAGRMDLEEGLKKVSDEHREVLVLRFIQGFSCEETAGILGKKSGAVRALQFRALKALKKHME